MPSGIVSCPFEECSHYGKLEYSEIGFFENHLASEHDFIELYQLALEKGMIRNRFQIQSLNFVVKRIARIFTFRRIIS